MAVIDPLYPYNVIYRCIRCENFLQGRVFYNPLSNNVTVSVEPCERCLLCAEGEIEELRKRIKLMYINGVTRQHVT